MIDIIAEVSFNWTEIVRQISIYTKKHNFYFVKSKDVNWTKIPQFSACQIFDVIKYFSDYEDESIVQLKVKLNKLENVGVSISFEERNKALPRRLKTNMLSYDGPSFHFADLFLTHNIRGIFRYHQIIHSEEEKKVRCKNYPYDGLESFGDCDKKYIHDKFLHDYKIMPFWVATDASHVTNLR